MEANHNVAEVLAAGISPHSPRLRAVVVGAQRLLRDLLANALKQVPDIETAAQFESVEELAPQLEKLKPDVVLACLSTGEPETLFDFVRRTVRVCSECKFMIVSFLHDTSLVSKAMEAGVSGFLFAEHIGLPGLVAAVRAARSGYRLFPDEDSCSRINPWHALFTHREIDVLRLMSRNLEREEIAREMSVSVGTVKNVISALLVKTGFKNIHRLLTHLLASGVLVSAGESAPQDER